MRARVERAECAVTVVLASRFDITPEAVLAVAWKGEPVAVDAAVSLVKQVTVVDGDIDPWDPVAVEHAVATRMRPERDLIVVPGVQADRAEPLEKDGVVGKLGIDATIFAPDRSDWTRAGPPDAVLARVRERIVRQLGDSSATTPGRPWSWSDPAPSDRDPLPRHPGARSCRESVRQCGQGRERRRDA